MKPKILPALAVTTGGDVLIDSVREFRTYSAAKDWQELIDNLERRGVGAKAVFTTVAGNILLVENVGPKRMRKRGGAR